MLRNSYVSPETELVEICPEQIFCQSKTNTTPNMGWGGDYNEEPED